LHAFRLLFLIQLANYQIVSSLSDGSPFGRVFSRAINLKKTKKIFALYQIPFMFFFI
jgi:hypothetical protein